VQRALVRQEGVAWCQRRSIEAANDRPGARVDEYGGSAARTLVIGLAQRDAINATGTGRETDASDDIARWLSSQTMLCTQKKEATCLRGGRA